MAADELILTYNPQGSSIPRAFLTWLSPLWKLTAPLAAIGSLLTLVFYACLHSLYGGVDLVTMLAISCGCTCAWACCYLLESWLKQDEIRLTARSIELPPWATFSARRKVRLWQDVTRVWVRYPWLNLPSEACVGFQFNDRVGCEIALYGLQPSKRDAFVAAVAQVTNSPELIDLCSELNVKLPVRESGDSDLPYVRSLSTASFVPIDPGLTLQSGRVVIKKQLVLGGLSAVYLATFDGTDAILKESHVPESADQEYRQKALEMFDREARLLAKINHPNIAAIYDHFVEDGRHYIAMELVRGSDLRRKVKDGGPLSEQTTMRLALQIADALSYLHEQSPPIIHRDLTPDNLVLTDTDHLYIIDFGAANELLGTATGTLIGKQAYIAPEQFRRKAEAASDIYSLGGTLHYLATGCDPIALTQSRPRAVRSDLSEAFDALVADCTNMDKASRPTARQLGGRIKEALACSISA